jgi:hypothetical protein
MARRGQGLMEALLWTMMGLLLLWIIVGGKA